MKFLAQNEIPALENYFNTENFRWEGVDLGGGFILLRACRKTMAALTWEQHAIWLHGPGTHEELYSAASLDGDGGDECRERFLAIARGML